VPWGLLAILHFLDNRRSVKQLTHLLRLFPIKIRQPGNQEGTHGTKTSYRRQDCSCNGVDHPNGYGVPRRAGRRFSVLNFCFCTKAGRPAFCRHSALASQEFEVGPYQFVMADAAANNSLSQMNKSPGRRRRHLRSVRPCVLQSGKGRIVPLTRSA